MTWAKAVLTLLGIVSALISWLRERKAVDAAMGEAVRKLLREIDDDVELADRARSGERDALRADPGRLRSDDGFRRD